MPDHMNKGFSQEHSIDEGYETPTDPCPIIDRVARRDLKRDPNYDPQECEVKYTSLVLCVYLISLISPCLNTVRYLMKPCHGTKTHQG
jgi:hypothetical protein